MANDHDLAALQTYANPEPLTDDIIDMWDEYQEIVERRSGGQRAPQFFMPLLVLVARKLNEIRDKAVEINDYREMVIQRDQARTGASRIATLGQATRILFPDRKGRGSVVLKGMTLDWANQVIEAHEKLGTVPEQLKTGPVEDLAALLQEPAVV